MFTALERVTQLLSDYNKYRNQTWNIQKARAAKAFVRDLGSKNGIPAMQKFDAWCVSNGVDPRRYLYFLFKERKFMFAPPWRHLVPSKKIQTKNLEKYAMLTATPEFSKIIHSEIHEKREQEGETFDMNRDLSPLAENMKRIYLADSRPDMCMEQMETYTFGYHPKSVPCARCPIARQCLSKLQAISPFDILALRRGELTLREAQTIAGRACHG